LNIEYKDQEIARQRELIAALQREGHSTVDARALLADFEKQRVTLVAYRDRLVDDFPRLGAFSY
jgi:hypothetical protein